MELNPMQTINSSPDVFGIVQQAIRQGIIDGITITEFREELQALPDYKAREDYIQTLWDRL